MIQFIFNYVYVHAYTYMCAHAHMCVMNAGTLQKVSVPLNSKFLQDQYVFLPTKPFLQSLKLAFRVNCLGL